MNLRLELTEILEREDGLTLRISNNSLQIEIEELYFNKEIIPIDTIQYGEIIEVTIGSLYKNYIQESTNINLGIRLGREKKVITISHPNKQYISTNKSIEIIDIDVKKDKEVVVITLRSDYSLNKDFEIYLAAVQYPDYKSSIENILQINENTYDIEIAVDVLKKTCFSSGAKLYISNGKHIIYFTRDMVLNNIVLSSAYILSEDEIYKIELNNNIINILKKTGEMIKVAYINTSEERFYVEIEASDEINLDDYNVVLIGARNKRGKYIPFNKNENIYSFTVSLDEIKTIKDSQIDIRLYHKEQQKMIQLYSSIRRSETLVYTPLTEAEDTWEIGYKERKLAIYCKEKADYTLKEKNSEFKKFPLKLKIKYSVVLIYSMMIYFISLIVRNRKAYSNIWLIGEMDDTAQDNGYHFFKYVRTHYPEMACYYLLNKNSVDIRNIEDLGNVIYRKSFKHILYLFLAKKHIGTHDYRHWHYPGYGNAFDKCFGKKIKGEFIQLQHGIMHIRSERGFHYDQQKYYDKIVVSSEKEKNLLKEYFKHPEENLIITGLARYDNLVDTSKGNKIITIMPTWRKGLRNKNFEKSNYYLKWMEILKDPYLNQVLEDHNIILQFYLHIKLQPYTQLFEANQGNNIRILKHGTKNVQDILKESNLLITDYSSVSLDFAYMKKPVIFYQFDYLSYLRSYAVLDWDEYKRSRFGFIGDNGEEIINKVIYYINNEFRLEDKYIDISKQYFKYRDTNNCERIFEAIR